MIDNLATTGGTLLPDITTGGTLLPDVNFGATKSKPAPVIVHWNGPIANNNDTRVRIIVPELYYNAAFIEKTLLDIGGIIFPYTPTITYNQSANYSPQNLMHANYTQYFYQRSDVGQIQIAGTFTVQNDNDARVFLSTQHLLRALIKMQTGNDLLPGAPPPVCRLKAYGQFMLDNVPIVVSNVSFNLTDDVDYYVLRKTELNQKYNVNSVPAKTLVTVTCNPVYSRTQIQDFSVFGWLNGDLRTKGYL